MLVTLLTLAVGAMLVPTLAARLDTPAVHHTAALSDVTAVILLLVYVASIPFWLRGGPHARADRGPRSGCRPTRPWLRRRRQRDGPTSRALAAQHGRHRAGGRRRRVGVCLGLVRLVLGPGYPLPRDFARFHGPGDRGHRLERRRERGRRPLRLESQAGFRHKHDPQQPAPDNAFPDAGTGVGKPVHRAGALDPRFPTVARRGPGGCRGRRGVSFTTASTRGWRASRLSRFT